MKVLFAAAEVSPFAKTGGLSNVAGSLPKAMHGLGVDARVILPLYSCVAEEYRREMEFLFHIDVELSWRRQYCGVFSLERDGVTWYFLDNEYYFKRDGLYGYYDDAERFAFYSTAIVSILPRLGWTPEIIHCNDWQTALVPVYLREMHGAPYDGIRTVFTIHNVEYQGRFPADTMSYVFGLPQELYDGGLLRFDGEVNLMKGALYKADRITTVSPTYAQELRSPLGAFGLHEIIEENSYKLSGIINGIDYDVYDPERDSLIFAHYNKDDLAGKAENKRRLQQQLGLRQDAEHPLIGCVSRLVYAKGFDMILELLDQIMDRGVQMVVLGTGDHWYEDWLREAQVRWSGRFASCIQFSDELASKIYAGADLFLMPSRSEPCGLTQMIAMRYGTVPLVRQTGGLKDTVRPYPQPDSNGFSFFDCDAGHLMQTIHYALDTYYTDKNAWNGLIRRGMETDFTWTRSARDYLKIYEELTGAK